MLFRSAYNVIEQGGGFVRFTRLPVPYASPDAMVLEAEQLKAAFPAPRRAGLRCLRDLRQARGNNDPGFEAILRRTRLQVFKGWGRLSALMQTQSGVLHCQRLFRDLEIVAFVTTDEQAAVAYLQSP